MKTLTMRSFPLDLEYYRDDKATIYNTFGMPVCRCTYIHSVTNDVVRICSSVSLILDEEMIRIDHDNTQS